MKIKDTDFLIIDLETTGLNIEKDSIWEIGIIKILNFEIKEKISFLLNPQKKLNINIVKFTGIQVDELEACPTITHLKKQILKILDATIIVEHNSNNFDSIILQRELGTNLTNPIINNINFAKKLLKDQKEFNLSGLAKRFLIDFKNGHRAIYDAEITAQIFIILLKYCSQYAGITNTDKLLNFINNQ